MLSLRSLFSWPARSSSGQAEPPLPATSMPAEHQRRSIRSIIVGGTSVCNASCVHCPTNKSETAHVVTGVMSNRLFESIIDQLARGYDVRGYIGYGLFGDALVDPLVVERTAYIRERLPYVTMSIGTNAAAYNREKHSCL